MGKIFKSYSELVRFKTFEERFNYLKLSGEIGKITFGYDRQLNQTLYRSPEWRSFRNRIILRDGGCDLACSDRPLKKHIIIHHLNPLTKEQILNRDQAVFDPENVVCCSHNTHEAIHYSDESLLFTSLADRKPNDTIPWRD